MSYEKVKQARSITIGTKQTVKALNAGMVQEIIIAEDAALNLNIKLVHQAKNMGVPVTYVDSMKKLGRICGITVGAAAVAILK